jgi:hypothetical protein
MSTPRGERFKVSVPKELSDALDELAVDMKTDPIDALGRLLTLTLEQDAYWARAALGVLPRRAVRAEATQ